MGRSGSTRGITVVDPATETAAASAAGAPSFSSSTHPEKDNIDAIAKKAIKKETNGLFIRDHPLWVSCIKFITIG
jgi:hypothetical protein